jgi:hypothetical protein
MQKNEKMPAESMRNRALAGVGWLDVDDLIMGSILAWLLRPPC